MIGLDTGLMIARDIQPNVRKLGYHVALGGGVLNKGMSEKDLDLYFLPLVGEAANHSGLVAYLYKAWGVADTIGCSGGDTNMGVYRDKLRFQTGHGRIEAFIVREP